MDMLEPIRRAARRGAFTALEMLIVVFVLGILATLVVPQFHLATDDAKLNCMTNTLGAIRKQLELYRFEHRGSYPTDHSTLEAQLTQGTTVSGTAGSDFGPYLMRMPDNPFIQVHTISNTAVIDATPATVSAWYYDTTVPVNFRANDSEHHHLDY